jgi:two-component system, chemotaxis family, CheB/CheR fusion protein
VASNETASASAAPAALVEPQLYVVGIGASSGGLPALQALLGSVPPNPDFACVIVVHLSPEHESRLPGLLQAHTGMPVQQVTSTVPLERNRVYVIPPNANLDTIDTHLRLTQPEERRRERAPIDHFLSTLAATHGGTAIGVVLTGAGTDGSIGLRRIKECGGLTIAQDPHEAEFESMPRSAIATGMVDLVLPLSRMSEEILRFCVTRPLLPVPGEHDEVDAFSAAVLEEIQNELRKKTELDLSVYKRETLLKRLDRRMRLCHVTTLAAYLEILSHQRREAEALTKDLLLTPTEFFKDTELFLDIEQRIIPRIFDRKSLGDRVRIWSIGCGTGEEAYSLAMLLVEESERRRCGVHLQVFASDAAERIVAMAREGIYPREIATSMPSPRLQRFFTQETGFFRVKREIRDLVLFASHSLFKDPPFGHIDLIVCRNLLSDLQPEVRQGVLNLFHYALEPDGLLLVGQHDEVDTPQLFEADGGPTRLFRRTAAPRHRPALPISMQPFGPGGIRGTAEPVAHSEVATIYRSAIEPYLPPSVLIDGENDVVHFSASAARYVHIPGSELTHDLSQLVREPIRSQLVDGLRSLREGSKSWSSDPSYLPTEHGLRRVILRLELLASAGVTLVVFDDSSPITSQDTSAADSANTVLEELATSKEELEAVNQELLALDEENRKRVRELTQISTDLQHLLAATGIATLLLDRELRIVRFTPLLGELFALRLSDVGRPISELARLAHFGGFAQEARRVLEQVQPVDRELLGPDGHWYLNRLLPYRTDAARVAGVVLTLIEITERKRAEQALQEASRQKDEFLAVLAHELRNPLAPISSGIEVLKAAPGDRSIVERISATMGRQAKQLVRLVDDLLEVSRISGGKLRLRTSVMDLNEVVQDAIASTKPSLESAGHTLQIHSSAEPLPVEGDGARLTQVICNLLNNAVRYTPSPGVISITAARDGANAVLTVKDNGVGITSETLKHVFEMFYQGRNARSGPGAGLGIGLTLAKTLVEMHRGSISVHSAGENEGSEFSVRLPLAKRSAAGDPLVANRADPTFNSDHRILIVDDNTDAAETLCMLMKSLGEREVHTASNGPQALEAATQLHPDIVLLDLMMPEMDGYEIARRMRSEPWGKDLLLVAVSGWGHEEHRRRSKEAGFDRHMTKPADVMALRAVLQEVRPSI